MGRAVRAQAGAENRLVHAASGAAAGRAAACAAAASSGALAGCIRRIRALVGRRYAAPLSSRESAASAAPVLRNIFCAADAGYASIYPIGQGLMLAIGRAIFGLPWAGVLLATAALCSLCYWMLRAWTTPEWALLGGVLAVIEFGPLSHMDEQLLGRLAGGRAGCLVFGALPRLRAAGGARDGALAGFRAWFALADPTL